MSAEGAVDLDEADVDPWPVDAPRRRPQLWTPTARAAVVVLALAAAGGAGYGAAVVTIEPEVVPVTFQRCLQATTDSIVGGLTQ